MIEVTELQAIPALQGLPDETLTWLASHLEEIHLEPGGTLVQRGDPPDWMFILFSGQIRGVFPSDTGRETAFSSGAGDITGMLPHSRMTSFRAEMRTTMPTRAGRLHVRHFGEIAQRFPELEARLAHILIDRARLGTRAQLQQEKLASLGTMAAGLAHELNNPASAARRAARDLIGTLQEFGQHASSLLRPVLFRDPPDNGDPFKPLYDIINGESPHLDPITRGEREDELVDWLQEQGVAGAWDAAATLVTAGLTRGELEDFTALLQPDQVPDFLRWLPRDVAMRQLADELVESTIRISDLVGAMKSYTFMDQADGKKRVDLHAGIENTLVILNHKLKHRTIEIVRDFGEIPEIAAHGGELNQVWTNLLDNAIAAAPEEGGRIAIRTRWDVAEEEVVIDIEDNGPGIPSDIRDRIFEPFFTTKPVGEGTGLGLDITRRIVDARHGGTIEVESEPGSTCFRVRLPAEEQESRSHSGGEEHR